MSCRWAALWPGMLSGAGGRLRRGLICVELGTRGHLVGREMLSVFVGGRARSCPGNNMNGLFPLTLK